MGLQTKPSKCALPPPTHVVHRRTMQDLAKRLGKNTPPGSGERVSSSGAYMTTTDVQGDGSSPLPSVRHSPLRPSGDQGQRSSLLALVTTGPSSELGSTPRGGSPGGGMPGRSGTSTQSPDALGGGGGKKKRGLLHKLKKSFRNTIDSIKRRMSSMSDSISGSSSRTESIATSTPASSSIMGPGGRTPTASPGPGGASTSAGPSPHGVRYSPRGAAAASSVRGGGRRVSPTPSPPTSVLRPQGALGGRGGSSAAGSTLSPSATGGEVVISPGGSAGIASPESAREVAERQLKASRVSMVRPPPPTVLDSSRSISYAHAVTGTTLLELPPVMLQVRFSVAPSTDSEDSAALTKAQVWEDYTVPVTPGLKLLACHPGAIDS